MNTFSIMCDYCETILEYRTQTGITSFMKDHAKKCAGHQDEPTIEPGPLQQAYKNYLDQQTPKKQMEHITEQIKDSFK